MSEIPGYSAQVSLDSEVALRLFVDLEEVVVSLDRILSRIGAGADPGILVNYVVDRQIFQRLAAARRDVTDAIEEHIPSEVLEELAEKGYRYTDPA